MIRHGAAAFNPLPTWDQLGHRFEGLFPAIAWSIVILIATYAGSRVAANRVRSMLGRGGFQPNVAILLGRTFWLILWLIGLVLAISQFSNGLAPLAALVGVFGLAASLSLQQVLQNLVAGVYLLAERPFDIGDYIAVVGPFGVNHEGRVEDIQMRGTRLRNRDDELILVPNSAIFAGVVTNRTAVGGFVRHVMVTFPRQTDVEQARSTMLPMLQSLPSVLAQPRPQLRVEQVGKEDWTACLSLWARNYEADSDALWAISQAFPQATINGGTESG